MSNNNTLSGNNTKPSNPATAIYNPSSTFIDKKASPSLSTSTHAIPDRYFYVLFQDQIWECDGYSVGSERNQNILWNIHIICPICRNNITLDSAKKKLCVNEYGLETAEPIRCSWPAEFGGLCPFNVVLEPPPKHLKQIKLEDGRQVTLDAIAKRV